MSPNLHPDDVPGQLSGQFTTKSLQISVVSVLMFYHRLIVLGDIYGCSGHSSTGTSLDSGSRQMGQCKIQQGYLAFIQV